MSVTVLKSVDMLNSVMEECNISNTPIVIVASASWCGPCKAVKPKYVQMATMYPEAMFFSFDIEEQQDLAEALNISSMPTFIVIHGMKIAKRQEGADLFTIRYTLDTIKATNLKDVEVVPMNSTNGALDFYAHV